MASYNDLPIEQKLFTNALFSAAINAVAPNDPTGHLPNCGYSDESPNCGCSAMGKRLHQAIVDEIAK